jgi:hypothetical protein
MQWTKQQNIALFGKPLRSTIRKASLYLALAVLALTSNMTFAMQGTWRFAGANLANTANNPNENEISPANVGSLVNAWTFLTAPACANTNTPCADVTAAPAVIGHMVYFPDWAGNLWAVDNRTHKKVWSVYLPSLTGHPKMQGLEVILSRTTPAIAGNLIIIGGSGNVAETDPVKAIRASGAVELAFNRHTGELVWATQLDNQPTAFVTQSAVVKAGTVYVGVSSNESFEVATGLGSSKGAYTIPGTSTDYKCCSFRGSMVALDLKTGVKKWQFFTIPLSPGEPVTGDWTKRPTGATASWAGNAVWGSTPVIDLSRQLLYFGTGQTHTLPLSVTCANGLAYNSADCVAAGLPYSTTPRNPAGNYGTSIIALNLKDGSLKWTKSFGKLAGFDGWTGACISWVSVLGSPLPFDFASAAYCPANESIDLVNPANNVAQLNNPFDYYTSTLITGGMPTQNYVPVNGPIPAASYGPSININGVPPSPPYPAGTLSWDSDFAQGPMLVKHVKMPNNAGYKDLIIAAQKNGITRALDAGNQGAVVWTTFEGTGGKEGGHEWGSATDGKRVYTANNIGGFLTPTIIRDVNGNLSTTLEGYWSALDIATGKILWETAAPRGAGAPDSITGQPGPGALTGAVSVANGVVYGGVRELNGGFYGLNAATGEILFSFNTGAAVNARATIVNGTVYVGSGYSVFSNSNNKLFAFTLPPHQCYADDETDQNDNNDSDVSGDDDNS